ncbi:hypothetical protein AUP41_06460 [Thalassospira xiamenensis]|jgi:glycosyltransferase involved in cell wall biosynthesis|nr:hypothetical protein AUP41_06460 [Thalassospira xiamenensis]
MNGDSVILPIEEKNSAALLPVLKLLAACTRSRKICIVNPDLRIEVVSRWQIVRDMTHFLAASIACLWAAFHARAELAKLLSVDRSAFSPPSQNAPVLYLKTNLWFGIKAGGSVGHIAGIVNGLQRSGHPVTFASAEPAVMIDDDVKMMEINPPSAFGLPYELNNYRFQKKFDSELDLKDALDSAGFIYQRLSSANYLGALLSRRHGVPLVLEYNGSEVWVAKYWGRGMRFQKLAEMAEDVMLKHAHLVVTISEVLREELITRGVSADRIVCYPNCIDPVVFSPKRFSLGDCADLRKAYGISEHATVLTFIGTFGQWHGAEMLAEAIARLYLDEREWLMNNKVHFLLVGDGVRMPNVRALIEESGALEMCSLTGLVPQDQAALHLAASDVLISPHVPNADGSRFFGSPTKLFEYMAMEKGIVASRLDQIEEVLSPALDVQQLPQDGPDPESKELAVLYEPGDLEQLIQGIKFLVNNKQWRCELGMNARDVSMKKYTWEHHVQAILDKL